MCCGGIIVLLLMAWLLPVSDSTFWCLKVIV